MNEQLPVFYDSTRRRQTVASFLFCVIAILAVIAFCGLIVSIVETPTLDDDFGSVHERHSKSTSALRRLLEWTDTPVAEPTRRHPAFDPHVRARLRYVLGRDTALSDAKKQLAAAVKSDENLRQRTAKSGPESIGSMPISLAFYVNDNGDSLASLQQHSQQVTHLAPTWITLAPLDKAGNFTGGKLIQNNQQIAPPPLPGQHAQPSFDQQAELVAEHNGIAILPVLQNCYSGSFQDPPLWAMLDSEANRTRCIAQLGQLVTTNHFQGVNVDLETFNPDYKAKMSEFMEELSKTFHKNHLLVTQDILVASPAYDLQALAHYNDFLVPMIYDEHVVGGAGPVASNDWFRNCLASFMSVVPANKTVIGISQIDRDWTQGSPNSSAYKFGDATQLAKQEMDGTDGLIQTDPRSGNPFFTYYDDSQNADGHVVWMQDAVTAYNELRIASSYHPLGAALWRLGSEDPSLWDFFGKVALNQMQAFDPRSLSSISYGYFGTETVGQGDVLSVVGLPTIGLRNIAVDHSSGLITSEKFIQFPSQYVVERTGLVNQTTGKNTQKIVALTFDDGPNPEWTPEILDILHRFHVKATFFVVGECAESNPGLVAREWDEGMEIGNHSFTHPNMDLIQPERIKLELDATQRVIEAITGHETMLFRAPNSADSDPSSWQDLAPVIDGDKLGYLFIGEKIDPTDWAPGVTSNEIVDRVEDQVGDGNCILMHDAGGETREETVKALPIIIRDLKNKGYKFVLVSDLTGKTRAELFPEVQGMQRWYVSWDRFAFDASYWIGCVLTAVFILTIILGIGRIIVFTALAVIQYRTTVPPPDLIDYRPEVSVVIAAYNEAKVINRTIETLLRSTYPNIEIVVVDDGSTDGTADHVRSEFGHSKQVRIIQKDNGGKASALNMGIKVCRGEIIVALDADTVFTDSTIGNLVRHFVDPTIGAVSGNVKVGNRRNPWTWWQALEYVTSQNFDRRAFDLLNCISVVPGAVGAWRKDAVVLAGLYSSQTLAEDTDLTFKVRKLGYRIVTDNAALAYTEAPDTLRDLAKQRFRWAFGTLQCLWKHRSATFNPRYGAFGSFAIPSLWLYQIVFQAVAPLVDVAIFWTIFYGSVFAPQAQHDSTILLLKYWAVFTMFELASAYVALRLDKEDIRLIFWLPLQRFMYRQMMYYVILKSIVTAVKGTRVGWGKLDRRGTVTFPTQPELSETTKEEELIEAR